MFCCVSKVCTDLQKLSAVFGSFCSAAQTSLRQKNKEFCLEATICSPPTSRWDKTVALSPPLSPGTHGLLSFPNMKSGVLQKVRVIGVWRGDPSTAVAWPCGIGEREMGRYCSIPVVDHKGECLQGDCSHHNFKTGLYVIFGEGRCNFEHSLNHLYLEDTCTSCIC